ncbi:MAG: hypothetical protein J6O61_10205, partial [Butyrivibrio sp.]|uniref:hypothetical protein n=1 Tax=Butyrivibrio sp. TaxID=28121 RepID=UPI001B12E6D5
HFPNDIEEKRVISFTKIGENESIQIYLNCEENAVEIEVSGFEGVVYSRKWSDGKLEPNGVLILKK